MLYIIPDTPDGATGPNITEALTENGDLFLVDAKLAFDRLVDQDPGDQGTVLVALGVNRGDHDEVRVSPGADEATPVHVIVRAIELLEQLRDDLREAGQV